MSQIWNYPTAAAATSTITFDVAAHLIGDAPTVEFNQATERSKGGTMFSESFGAAKRLYPFSAYIYNSHATSADFADLITWLVTTVNGAENSFQWTDEDSTVRTVRITDGSISIERTGQYRKFSCNLEEQ